MIVASRRSLASSTRVVSLEPRGGREERDGDGETEEDLGQAGVRRRDRRRQEEQDRQTSEHTLKDDRRRAPATPSHFIQRRGSTRHSHAASTMVRNPTVLAINRCPCS